MEGVSRFATGLAPETGAWSRCGAFLGGGYYYAGGGGLVLRWGGRCDGVGGGRAGGGGEGRGGD